MPVQCSHLGLIPTPSTLKAEAVTSGAQSTPIAGKMQNRSRPSRRRIVLSGVTLFGAMWAGLVDSLAGLNPTPPLVKGMYPVGEQRPEDDDADLARRGAQKEDAAGRIINLDGRVLRADGSPIANARVEIWHTDSNGFYHHPDDPNEGVRDANFQGYGELRTGTDGRINFRTIRPGSYSIDQDTVRTPHIHLQVTAADHEPLATQLFFANEPLNEQDIILKELSEQQRKQLTVDFTATGDSAPLRGTIDIVLG